MRATLLFIFIGFLHEALSQNNARVLEYITKIDIDNNKLNKVETLEIQINDPQSNWISKIRIPYSNSNDVKILEAVILDHSGKELRQLKKNEISTKSDISQSSLYEDDFVKEFDLKWNEYPYRIRYSYRIQFQNYLSVANWTPRPYSNIPVRKAELSVSYPLDYGINIKEFDIKNYASDTLDDRITIKWQLSDIKRYTDEAFSPPYWETEPRVFIVPDKFQFSTSGSHDSWGSFGNWVNSLNTGLDRLPPSEETLVHELVASEESDYEKTKILYTYLQSTTRYINISLGTGGMKPYSATYVSTKKYGDCKALTIYMKALLNAINVDSYYTLVNAGDNPERIIADLPSQQFNHVILCVPNVLEDTLWLENTSSYLPVGYLGTFTQARKGLIVSTDSKLVDIPALLLEDVSEISNYTFNLTEEGNGELSLSKTVRGELFEDYLYLNFGASKKHQKEFLEGHFQIQNYELNDWSFTRENSNIPEIHLKALVECKNQFRMIGKSTAITPVPIEMPSFERPDLRAHPVRIIIPINKQDSIGYDLTPWEEYTVKLPENRLLSTKYGVYTSNYRLVEKKLVVTKLFQLFNGDYSLIEYPEFYDFINQVKEYDRSVILIKRN